MLYVTIIFLHIFKSIFPSIFLPNKTLKYYLILLKFFWYIFSWSFLPMQIQVEKFCMTSSWEYFCKLFLGSFSLDLQIFNRFTCNCKHIYVKCFFLLMAKFIRQITNKINWKKTDLKPVSPGMIRMQKICLRCFLKIFTCQGIKLKLSRILGNNFLYFWGSIEIKKVIKIYQLI